MAKFFILNFKQYLIDCKRMPDVVANKPKTFKER